MDLVNLPSNVITKGGLHMQSTPMISIVLPTYNHVQLLPVSVQSILGQTVSNFELIIVDDGSTDGTRKYLGSLTDPRLVIISQPNMHLPNALNTGFDRARGKYLTWTSDDNYCSPMFLEMLVATL